jgi:transcription elongation factor GreA
MTEILLTKEGFAALETELKELQKVTLPEIKKRMALAREDGDLSENNSWILSKEEMEITNMRISEIKSMLKTAKLVSAQKNSDTVSVGNTIDIIVNGHKMTIMLVPTLEADPLANKLSIESPIGKAVIGKKVGDEVSFDSPAGAQSVKITAKR